MTAVQRVLLPETNQSPAHVTKGILVANELCKASGLTEVIFLIPTKDSLTSGSLRQALGEAVLSAMVKGQP